MADWSEQVADADDEDPEMADSPLALAPDALSLEEAQDAEHKWRTLVWGSEGCHEPEQEILMHDGSIEKVKEIEAGDELMGPDSSPRKVLEVHSGEDEMYEITPVKGESFTVNSKHPLTLQKSGKYGGDSKPDIVDVPVEKWMKWTDTDKKHYKLVRTGVEFGKSDLKISPYVIGIFIGDGTLSQGARFTSEDDEIIQEMEKEAAKFGLKLSNYESGSNHNRYAISSDRGGGLKMKNPVFNHIKQMGLDVKSDEKFIPKQYLLSSKEQRLHLLAGLIDSDGSLSEGRKGGPYDWVSSSEDLADDMVYLSRSLGLAAYKSEKEVYKPSGELETYYRVGISGDLSNVPCRLERKQATPRKQRKSVLRTGFDVESVGKGEYIGFTVDGDNRYLMADFTITHNSGKTHFAYTSPTPVAFIDTEGKANSIAHKFDIDEDKFAMWQPEDYEEAVTALEQALEFLSYWKDEEDETGTIVVDSMSIMWDWAQDHHIEQFYPGRDKDDVNLSSGFGSGPSDWKEIKNFHNAKFRRKMLDSDFHLTWTAMAEEDYSKKMEEGLSYTPDKPAGEKSNKYKVTDVLRIVKNDDDIPVGVLEKAGLTKYRYSGLEYPTFEKHRTTIREIEEAELEGKTPDEMELTYDVDVAEGMRWGDNGD